LIKFMERNRQRERAARIETPEERRRRRIQEAPESERLYEVFPEEIERFGSVQAVIDYKRRKGMVAGTLSDIKRMGYKVAARYGRTGSQSVRTFARSRGMSEAEVRRDMGKVAAAEVVGMKNRLGFIPKGKTEYQRQLSVLKAKELMRRGQVIYYQPGKKEEKRPSYYFVRERGEVRKVAEAEPVKEERKWIVSETPESLREVQEMGERADRLTGILTTNIPVSIFDRIVGGGISDIGRIREQIGEIKKPVYPLKIFGHKIADIDVGFLGKKKEPTFKEIYTGLYYALGGEKPKQKEITEKEYKKWLKREKSSRQKFESQMEKEELLAGIGQMALTGSIVGPVSGTGRLLSTIEWSGMEATAQPTSKYVYEKTGSKELAEIAGLGIGLVTATGIHTTATRAPSMEIREVRVPTAEGEKVIWKGIAIETEGRSLPLVGKTDSFKVGTPKGLEISPRYFKGYVPETATEAKILRHNLKYPETELRKIDTVWEVMRTTKDVRSKYIQRAFAKHTKTFSPRGVKVVLKFAKREKAIVYGWYASEAQMPGRGFEGILKDTIPDVKVREAGDIDLQLRVGSAEAEKATKRLVAELREVGEKVRISKKHPTLIEAKGMDRRWHHAVDIHAKDIIPGSGPAGERAYGINLNRKLIKIQGLDTQSLSEQGVRKGASILGMYPERIRPALHRGKDIGDFINIQKVLLESKGRGGKAMRWLKEYEDIVIKTGEYTPKKGPVKVELYRPGERTPPSTGRYYGIGNIGSMSKGISKAISGYKGVYPYKISPHKGSPYKSLWKSISKIVSVAPSSSRTTSPYKFSSFYKITSSYKKPSFTSSISTSPSRSRSPLLDSISSISKPSGSKSPSRGKVSPPFGKPTPETSSRKSPPPPTIKLNLPVTQKKKKKNPWGMFSFITRTMSRKADKWDYRKLVWGEKRKGKREYYNFQFFDTRKFFNTRKRGRKK